MQNAVNEITTKHNKWKATTIDKVKLLVYKQKTVEMAKWMLQTNNRIW